MGLGGRGGGACLSGLTFILHTIILITNTNPGECKYGANHGAVMKVIVYRTLTEQDTGWLRWLLIILLMKVLGGLDALDPLFNRSSVQV